MSKLRCPRLAFIASLAVVSALPSSPMRAAAAPNALTGVTAACSTDDDIVDHIWPDHSGFYDISLSPSGSTGSVEVGANAAAAAAAASANESDGEGTDVADVGDADEAAESDGEEAGGTSKDSGWSPIDLSLSFDIDYFSKTVSLDRQKTNPSRLLFRDSKSGYSVETYVSLDLTLGIDKSYAFPTFAGLSGVSAGVGLLPSTSMYGLRLRHARSYTEAKRLTPMPLPMHARDLQSWSNEDELTYRIGGGIGFYGYVGAVGISLSASYVASGVWEVYIHKIDRRHVDVQITNIGLDTLAAALAYSFASVEASRYDEKASLFSFRIDVSDPLGAKAYADLVRGNVAAIQRIALSHRSKAVRHYESTRRQRVGSTFELKFGIPLLLHASTQFGSIYELNRTNSHWNGSHSTTQYGIYVQNTNTALLTNQNQEVRAFYGSLYEAGNKQGRVTESSQTGRLQWRFRRDETTSQDLRDSLGDIIAVTGLKKELSLQIPDAGQLGFSEVDFRMTLDEKQTARLIAVAAHAGLRQRMIDHAADLVRETWRGPDDRAACEAKIGVAGVQEETTVRYRNTCLAKLLESTEAAMSDMHDALLAMRAARTGRALSVAYADFGRAMIENQFAFQTALRLAGAGAKFELSIVGERIAQHCQMFAH